jgi:hypothetical protein
MNKKFLTQVFIISIVIAAGRTLVGCGSPAEESRVEKSYQGSGDAVEAEPAVAAEPAAPEPPTEPEKISVWSGECYGFAGTKLWFGKATNVNMGSSSSFSDEMAGKKVELYGEHNCVWRYELDRAKREGEGE